MNYKVHDGQYYMAQGYIDAREDDCCITNKRQAVDLCGGTYCQMGSTAYINGKVSKCVVWCPNNSPSNVWSNILEQNEDVFREYRRGTDADTKKDIDECNSENCRTYIKDPIIRIIFLREDSNTYYRFLGIYVLDVKTSKENNELVWRRISMRLNLSELPRILDLAKCVNDAVVQSSCGLI